MNEYKHIGYKQFGTIECYNSSYETFWKKSRIIVNQIQLFRTVKLLRTNKAFLFFKPKLNYKLYNSSWREL